MYWIFLLSFKFKLMSRFTSGVHMVEWPWPEHLPHYIDCFVVVPIKTLPSTMMHSSSLFLRFLIFSKRSMVIRWDKVCYYLPVHHLINSRYGSIKFQWGKQISYREQKLNHVNWKHDICVVANVTMLMSILAKASG